MILQAQLAAVTTERDAFLDQLAGFVQLQTELAAVTAERDVLLGEIAQTALVPPLHEYVARTRARESSICRDNHVKNAWCAYHNTARLKAEKQRPERTLSCKCTFEEALLEEELARNGVGSLVVVKGDAEKVVRLHPSLRRSLLRLLVERYNYRDGDFDVDPKTGQWKDGQHPESWAEAEVNPGPPA